MTNKTEPFFPSTWMLLIISLVFTIMLAGTTIKLDDAERQVVERDQQIVELGDHFVPLLAARIQALRDRLEISEMKFQHERWRMEQEHAEVILINRVNLTVKD